MLETLVVPSCRPADSRPRKPPFHSVLLRPSGDTKKAIWNSDLEKRSFCEERLGLEMWIWNCDLVTYCLRSIYLIFTSDVWLAKCAGVLVSVSPPLRAGPSRGPAVGSESRTSSAAPERRAGGWAQPPVIPPVVSARWGLRRGPGERPPHPAPLSLPAGQVPAWAPLATSHRSSAPLQSLPKSLKNRGRRASISVNPAVQRILSVVGQKT